MILLPDLWWEVVQGAMWPKTTITDTLFFGDRSRFFEPFQNSSHALAVQLMWAGRPYSGARMRALCWKAFLFIKEEKADLLGLRDRTLIGLMVYSFARVSAVVNMKVSDYRQVGKRFQVSLHEKDGEFHRLPVHHKAEEYIDEYLEAAGIGEDKKSPLWRSANGKSGRLTANAMDRIDVFKMIKRRAKVAGVALDIGCHTFRATGITAYLIGGGTVESAQQIAKHKSPRTTKLYDRRGDKVTLDEIERINL